MLKLKTIEFSEKRESKIEYIVNPVGVMDFNLFIGDNAQGKSRFFRTLHFLSLLFSGAPIILPTYFNAKFKFSIESDIDSVIEYELEIEPKNSYNIYNEIILKDGNKIFVSANLTPSQNFTKQPFHIFSGLTGWQILKKI